MQAGCVIHVDLPDHPGRKLLVHGCTGAFDLVSSPVAACVRALETRPPAKPLFGAWKSDPPRNGVATQRPSDDTLTATPAASGSAPRVLLPFTSVMESPAGFGSRDADKCRTSVSSRRSS